jgi:CheY-like chemotaxis protein
MKAILFVDDHEVLARLSCEILQSQGYRAEYAYNPNDALAKFDRETFDLVVTDYRMEGMNGVELARKIRQKAPEIPVVVVTGYGPEEGCDEVSAWLEKQDLFPALLDKIKQFIGEGEAEAVRTA